MNDLATESTVRPRRVRPRGPHPGAIAVVAFALTVMSIAIPAANGGVPISPFDSASSVVDHYLNHGLATRLNGLFLFLASVPTGIFGAAAVSRMRQDGIRVPGTAIAYFGAITASVCLATSGFVQWALGESASAADTSMIRPLAYLGFALGGVGYAGGLGLLIAGIAVPMLVVRAAPRWYGALGMVIAVIAELGFLALVDKDLAFALPIARFGGSLWLIGAGFIIAAGRFRRPRTGPAARARRDNADTTT